MVNPDQERAEEEFVNRLAATLDLSPARVRRGLRLLVERGLLEALELNIRGQDVADEAIALSASKRSPK